MARTRNVPATSLTLVVLLFLAFPPGCACQPLLQRFDAGSVDVPRPLVDGGELECLEDADCAFGDVCQESRCRPSDPSLSDVGCWSDEDCASDEVCALSTGRCVPATTVPDPSPVDTGACTTGETRFCGTKVGACRYGIETCVDGAWSTACEGGVAPSDERCDGIDDDCDGESDEDYVLGESCTDGVGACLREGITVCGFDTESTRCSAAAATPADQELCGGPLDEDCDGEEEEGFTGLGEGCTVGVGACTRNGTLICSDDRTSMVCSASEGSPAPAERCGFDPDDDCDGEIDAVEFPLLGTACEVGSPPCAQPGTYQCSVDGSGVECVPVVIGSAEVCNETDDTGEGCIDEGFAVGVGCAIGIGACRATATTICSVDGLSTFCPAVEGTPAPAERCGFDPDDDCDGLTDAVEFPTLGLGCSVGNGICARSGELTCTTDGVGVQCSAVEGLPAPIELCGNNLDDDCDGLADAQEAAFLVLGQSCTVGVGECSASGQWICNAAGLVACSALPGVPSPETCDGSDEDCNGVADNGCDDDNDDYCDANMGFGGVPVAACPLTTSLALRDCNDAAVAIHPGATEICNDGIDQNCNGDLNDGCGLCDPDIDRDFDGVDECADCNDTNGAVNPSATEVCDGIDNDCDTAVDEGFDSDGDTYTTCGTMPSGGLDAAFVDCNDTNPAVYPFACELCALNGVTQACGLTGNAGNSVDEDCDGYVDENCAPCDNIDRDGDGQSECEGDCAPNDGAVESGPASLEVCDGKDNDCNLTTTDNCGVSDPCNHDGDGNAANDPDICADAFFCVQALGPSGQGTGDFHCSSFCNWSTTGPVGDGCASDEICASSLTPTANLHGCAQATDFGAALAGAEVTDATQCRSGRVFEVGNGANKKTYCTDYCGSDSYCSNGTVCQAHVVNPGSFWLSECRAPGTTQTRGTGQACNDSAGYCRSGGLSCLQISTNDRRCSEICCTNTDCPSGYYCSTLGPRFPGPAGGVDVIPMCFPASTGNEGRPAGAACAANDECASEFCDVGLEVCVDLCCNDTTCPLGLTCEDVLMTLPTKTGDDNGQSFARACVSLSPAVALEPM